MSVQELEQVLGKALNDLMGLNDRESSIIGHRVDCYKQHDNAICVARAIEKIAMPNNKKEEKVQLIYSFPLFLNVHVNEPEDKIYVYHQDMGMFEIQISKYLGEVKAVGQQK